MAEVESDPERRFWLLDWDDADHANDLVRTMRAGKLVGVVDENDGGIVAYVIGEEYAEKIVDALEAWAELAGA